MATKKATATDKPKSIVKWSEKFASYAKDAVDQVKSIGSAGRSVAFGRGSIEVGGLPVSGGKLRSIVIGYCALNAWYKAKYDKDDKQPPDCYAFGDKADDPSMAPHEKAPDPQAELCADCEHNKYGTAETGRGKACGNRIRLGLITESDAETVEGASAAELATASVSPTNLKRWAGYVKSLEEEHQRPPWSVVTEITTYDDKETQIRVEFRMVATIDDDALLTVLEKRFGKIQDLLQVPFNAPVERVAPKSGAGKSRKFAGKPAAASKAPATKAAGRR